MENRLSQQSQEGLVPTRELPVRGTLVLPNRTRGFHETIGIAARRNCSPAPGAPVDSEDEGERASIPSSQASVAGDIPAPPTKRPRGRPRKNPQTTATEASGQRQTSQGPPPAKKRRGRPPKATRRGPRSKSTPPQAHVSESFPNLIETPIIPAANSMDSSTAEGEGENLEGRGRVAELATLEKLFEHVWSTYYASIDKISSDQMDSALKIFFERTLEEVEE